VSHKIYRNKRIDVTVLPQVKKELEWTNLAKSKTPKHNIMGVGYNDISNDTTPATVAERVAHVLDTPPVFERMWDKMYNRRVKEANNTIQKLCKQRPNSFYIDPKVKDTPFP
jgi:hypothetical protein